MYGTTRKGFKHRSPYERIPKKKLVIQDNDVFGLFYAAARYNELPSSYLYRLDGRYWTEARARLTDFHHDTANWKQADVPLSRSFETIGSHSYWTAGPAAVPWLVKKGVITPEQAVWVKNTKVGGDYPSKHNRFLAMAVAEIEMACKREGYRFINHLEALTRASYEAQHAKQPLHIPVQIRWQHKLGLQDIQTNLEPDALFGIEYPNGDVRFFFVEYDTGSENIVGTDLRQRTWLRKVLSYKAAAAGAAKRHFRFMDKFYVLILYPAPREHGDITKAIKMVFPEGSDMFCLQSYPATERNQPQRVLPPSDLHFSTEWTRVGHSPLSLKHI